MAKTTGDQICELRCEKLLNEAWSMTSLLYDDIKRIVEQEGCKDKDDETILLIAANVVLQKLTVDLERDKKLFNLPEK